MAFDKATIQKVWEKATPVANNDPARWRKDECGAWIGFKEYGNRKSDYGWEMDHIVPAKPGQKDDDSLSNLRPLHWENNVRKSDGTLDCIVTSQGKKNVRV